MSGANGMDSSRQFRGLLWLKNSGELKLQLGIASRHQLAK